MLLLVVDVLRGGLIPPKMIVPQSHRWSSVIPRHGKARGMVSGCVAAGERAELC